MSVEITDTAVAFARVRSWERELPEDERLFDDPYAHLFVGGEAADEAVRLLLSAPIFRDHVRLRTRFIDDALRAALAAGITQIVNLGAGFVWLDDVSLADVYGRYVNGDPPPGSDLYRFAVAWR
jgi:O-methyltransferase involved in polyketide biosynthesis